MSPYCDAAYSTIEIFDGTPFIKATHIIDTVKKMTYATSHTYKVEILTTGARCLLIAMMCFGKLDFVSVQGVEDFSKMVAMPMNMIEIRESVTGMISYVAQSKNIKIGHECTQLNLRNWVEELSNNGLIRVDQKDFIPGHIVKQVIHASFASKSHHIISYHIR